METYETRFTSSGIDLPLLWADEATRLYDQLAEGGMVDPETGESYTVRDCDNALQGAMESLVASEGYNGMPYGITERTWTAIRSSVAAYLGLSPEQVEAVAG